MTCAITVFVNFRLRLSENDYLGDYDDFTPNWFKAIGYSLGLTFLLKIFASIFFFVLKILSISIARCYDRGWNCQGTQTRKKVHEDYEKLYRNPDFDIDFCYTELVNVVFVAMTLSPLLPYVFYIALVYLIVLYCKDKWNFLLFSRIPPQFDESMSQKSRSILYVVIPFYLILCIWVFGNKNLLDETQLSYAQTFKQRAPSTSSNYQQFFGPIIKFIDRCTNGNVVIFTALLCVWVLYIIFKFVFGNIVWILWNCLCKWCVKKAVIKTKNRDVHYCWRVEDVYIGEEFELAHSDQPTNPTINKTISQKLQVARLQEYKQIEAIRRIRPDVNKLHRFTTLPSYDYRLHPDMSDFFIKKYTQD